MPKVASISQYVTWRSCIISFFLALIFSGPTTDFGRPLRNSSVRPNFQVTVNNTNNAQMTKCFKDIYGQKCQTLLCKYHMAPENTQCCQGSK